MSKLRASLVVMLVLAIGLFVYAPMTFAGHGEVTSPTWHSDNMTVNKTGSLGTNGKDFVPAWVKTDCDTPIGQRSSSLLATGATGCHAFAEEVLSSWLAGAWWDPRGGTEFIPPSGDHHRSGWRTMWQAHFSAGQWLAGFAPIASTFPFYPDIAQGAGPGESPVGVYELCADPDGAALGGAAALFSTATYAMEDANDTGGAIPALDTLIADCRAAARRAGALLLEFADHHGEPLTPGRFPRYIPHERQAWVSTLVTKYTSSPNINIDTGDVDTISDATGAKISQVFRTQHNYVTTGGPVTWFSMSNESAAGCAPSGWCQWAWDPATQELRRLTGATVNPGNPATAATVLSTGTPVTSMTVIDDFTDTVVTKNMNGIERAPSEIYQTIGQWVQLNEGNNPLPTAGDNQAFWSDFWVLSGPNFQSEEGANPYTWVLCGTVGSPAEENCLGASPGIDSPNDRTMAITTFGLDLINRYGGDLRPDNSLDQGCVQGDEAVGVCNDTTCAIAGSACDMGLNTAIVQCTAGGDTDSDALTSSCESTEGATNGYGNDANETIYYREAVENQQRGFVRENRSFAFSFATGTMGNGGSLSGALRQALAQNTTDGFLMSCLNCEPIAEHFVRNHAVPNYEFSWDLTGGVSFIDHADAIDGLTHSIP